MVMPTWWPIPGSPMKLLGSAYAHASAATAPTAPLNSEAVDTRVARPPRIEGNSNISNVPKPSTANGAMMFIAEMAVEDSPTSDARNTRAATAQ